MDRPQPWIQPRAKAAPKPATRMSSSRPLSSSPRKTTGIWLAGAVGLPLLAACGVTSRIEPFKQTDAVLSAGENVVILARKQHANHEAEEDFVQCISDSLAGGK